MSTGSWQHYLPATYLAGFSSAPAVRLRKSVLWVARRGRGSLYQQSAENVAAKHNIYTIDERFSGGKNDPHLVDRAWSSVEAKLAASIGQLAGSDRSPLGADWFANLVQFIAHVFARSVDFAARLPRRLRVSESHWLRGRMFDHSNVNMARIMECQRLLAPVLQAKWDVLHSADEPIVTNDMGRCPTRHVVQRTGYVFPLRSDLAVALYPGSGPDVIWDPARGAWVVTSISHVSLTRLEVISMNRAVADYARDEVYGGDRGAVVAAAGDFATRPDVHQLDEPVLLGVSPREARDREHEFFRFLDFISHTPSGEGANIAGLALWNAPIYFPVARDARIYFQVARAPSPPRPR